MLKTEGDHVTAIETAKHLSELENTLKMRKDDAFLSPTAEAEKNASIAAGSDPDSLVKTSNDFFGKSTQFTKIVQTFQILSMHERIPISTFQMMLASISQNGQKNTKIWTSSRGLC